MWTRLDFVRNGGVFRFCRLLCSNGTETPGGETVKSMIPAAAAVTRCGTVFDQRPMLVDKGMEHSTCRNLCLEGLE